MKEHRRDSSKRGGGDEGGNEEKDRRKSSVKGEGDAIMLPDQEAGIAAWRERCPGAPPCLAEGADEALRQRLVADRTQNLRWRLPMPPRFMPYMEKHRIYDLFYELAVELVVKKPKDHVQFLRHQLVPASYSKDRPRVILIGPPFFGLTPLGKKLAASLGVPYVPMLKRFHSPNPKQGCETTRRDGESLPRYAARVLRTEPLLSGGWVLAGFPRTAGEAEIIRRAGVRPTHVIQLVPSVTSKDTCLFSQGCKFTDKEVKAYLEYTRRIRGLREVFMPVLKEVDIRQPNLDSLVRACTERVRDSREGGPPSVFRVALIGPPGSGVHTQAKLLAQRFNLIIVDAGLEEVRTRLDDCQERLLDAAGEKIIPNDRVEVVQNRIMKADCLHFGWVLIACPRNVTEMRGLDRMDTPPNRVLVLDVPTDECRDRLVLRRFNKYTGAEYHLDRDQIPLMDRTALAVHPNDSPPLVDRKMNEYTSMLPTLLEYLGDSALLLRASGMPPDRVFEMVSAAVARRPAPFAPRDPEAPPPAAPPPTPMSQLSSAALSEQMLTKAKVSEVDDTMLGREVSGQAITESSSARESSRISSRPRLSARLAARSPRRPPTRYSLMAARVGWPYDRKSTMPTRYQRADSGDHSGSPRRTDVSSDDVPDMAHRYTRSSSQPRKIMPFGSLIPQHDTVVNRILAEEEDRTLRRTSDEHPIRRPSEDDSFTGGPKTRGRRSFSFDDDDEDYDDDDSILGRRRRSSFTSADSSLDRDRRSSDEGPRGDRRNRRPSMDRRPRLSSIEEADAERGAASRLPSGDGPRGARLSSDEGTFVSEGKTSGKGTTRRSSSGKGGTRFASGKGAGDAGHETDDEEEDDDDVRKGSFTVGKGSQPGKGSQGAGKMPLAAGKGSQGAGKGSIASSKGSQGAGKGSIAAGKGSQGAGKGAQMSKKGSGVRMADEEAAPAGRGTQGPGKKSQAGGKGSGVRISDDEAAPAGRGTQGPGKGTGAGKSATNDEAAPKRSTKKANDSALEGE